MAKKAKNSPMSIGLDRDWQAQQDMRTLIDAEKIKKDKARYKAACNCAKEEMAARAKLVNHTK